MPFDELILHFSFPFLAVSGFGFLLKPSAYSVLNNKQAAHIFWPAKGRQGWRKKDPRANSDSDEGRRKRPCLPLLRCLPCLSCAGGSARHSSTQRARRSSARAPRGETHSRQPDHPRCTSTDTQKRAMQHYHPPFTDSDSKGTVGHMTNASFRSRNTGGPMGTNFKHRVVCCRHYFGLSDVICLFVSKYVSPGLERTWNQGQ